MNNTDLFEKPFYTVHVNGLFGLTTKASVTKKFTDRSNTAEGLSRRIVGYTGQAGMEQFEQAMRDSFRDQLITGESSFRAGIDPINEDSEPIITRVTGDSIVERMLPIQNDYNRAMLEMDQALLRARTQNSVHTTREDLQRHAAQRLQRGEISVMDYLDLISRQQ